MKRSVRRDFSASILVRAAILASAFLAAASLRAQTSTQTALSPDDRASRLGARAVRVLRDALHDDDPEVRALAAETFGDIGNPKVAPVLERSLKDPDRYVRIAAAESLARLGDPAGAAALRHLASERPKAAAPDANLAAAAELKAVAQAKARAAAIRALIHVGPEGSERVLQRARRDSSGIVRDAAAAALARLGDADELNAFVAALQDPDEMVRLAAARSLGEVGSTDALPALAKAAKDSSPQVRAAAVAALGRVGSAAALGDLKAALSDESPLVRAKAIEGLGKLPLAAVAPLLEDARKAAKNAYLQLLAMEGLARLGRPVELGLPERSLEQPDVDTRLLAVRVLELAPGVGADDVLELALDDKETQVRVRAAAALLKRIARRAAPPAATEGAR